jgi:RNA polymerase sigma-70 factor, ECF subfamily
MVEDALLQRALDGDRQALDELCHREWRAIYGLLYRSVQNQQEAQDLTQEVFLRALRSLRRYRVTGRPFHSYLVTIAVNLLRDRWKARRYQLTDLEHAPDLVETDPGPEDQALSGLERQEVERALATLPDDYQTVIRLRVVEARSSRETGDLMGRSAESVRQLQRRALSALRQALNMAAWTWT